MSLRYKFHQLFFGGDVNKKRLYKVLEDLDSKTDSDTVYDDTDLKARVKAIEDAVGTYSSESTIAERLTALETPTQEPSEPSSGEGG